MEIPTPTAIPPQGPSTNWQPAPIVLPGGNPQASPTPQYQNGYQPNMPGAQPGSSMGHPMSNPGMRGHGMPGMQPGQEYQPPPQPTGQEYVPPPQDYFPPPPPPEEPTPYP
jgi:hypothetical protein